MLTSLDHLVIAVRDLDAATQTYAALLGRRPSWRGEHPQLGTANALFRLENTYIELLAVGGDGGGAQWVQRRLESDGEGLMALAFGTADASACALELRRRGLPAGAPIDGGGRDRVTGAERAWRNVFLPDVGTRGVPLFIIEHRSPPEALPMAPAAADEAATVSAVDHVVVMSGDAEASRRLYQEQLGLRLALDRTFESRGLRLLFFRVGHLTVEVSAPLAGAAPGGSDRVWGLAYRVRDADAARARLVAAGFDVSEVRPGQKPGTRVCTVRRETHGVATLIIEPA